MVNRLYGSSAYLCGPIDYVPDRGESWRDYITPYLQSVGIIVLDPLRKPLQEDYANKYALDTSENHKMRKVLKDGKQYNELAALMRKIRHVDLRMVDHCSFVIVNYDPNVLMTGTLEEIFWANRLKKPVLLCCTKGMNDIPDWLYGTLPHELFFNTWESILEYLTFLNTADIRDIDTYNRWVFFNHLLPTQEHCIEDR